MAGSKYSRINIGIPCDSFGHISTGQFLIKNTGIIMLVNIVNDTDHIRHPRI